MTKATDWADEDLPKLEAEVKEKVADVIHGGAGRQLVTTRDALTYLKAHVGAELTGVLCSVEKKYLVKFATGKDNPTPLQARNIAAAYVIVDILLAHSSEAKAKEWLISYSDYLYGIPAVEMSSRPEDVRMAALRWIAR